LYPDFTRSLRDGIGDDAIDSKSRRENNATLKKTPTRIKVKRPIRNQNSPRCCSIVLALDRVALPPIDVSANRESLKDNGRVRAGLDDQG